MNRALAAITILLVGCSNDERDTAKASAPTPAPPAAEEKVPIFKRSRPMMGTVFEISVADVAPALASKAVNAALDEIARLETVLSEWQATSDISKVNQAAGQHPVKVNEELIQVVTAGLEVSAWSRGAFDISWAALRNLYDFTPGKSIAPRRLQVRKRLPAVNWRNVAIDPVASTIFLKKAGMAIGTGGIGKGYALDQAGRILREAGIDNYMLFGGGQVQVRGQRTDRKWRVGIQHPRKPDYFAMIEADSGSLSTSGDYEHYFTDKKGHRWHHILDPRTGMPAKNTLSVTALSESGMYADAISTAAFVLGAKRALAMVKEAPGAPELVIVDGAFRVHTTDHVRNQLVPKMDFKSGTLPH